MSIIKIRSATPQDCPLLTQLISDLAVYEKLAHECKTTPDALHAALFSPRPVAEALIGEVDGVPQGFALFFTNFSTFVCKPGLYLEDLFVRPEARGVGLGKALLSYLGKIALERGYGRVEWVVLDWNSPAIEFYKKLGARPLEDWTIFRVSGDGIQTLANACPPVKDT